MAQDDDRQQEKQPIVLLSVPELLEDSIIDDAKYYSHQYLKELDIFSSNDSMKARKKTLFMSRWIIKIVYYPSKKLKTNHLKLTKPLSADDLYKAIYPRHLQMHKLKILCFLDPNMYNKSTKHNIKLPQYKNTHNKFGNVHITYLPAAKQNKDMYHTSCDYNGYHYTYKLYDLVNFTKQWKTQCVAETYFYKQKINHHNRNKSVRKKYKYSKKQILDLKSNENDRYIAFLMCFVWNLFSIFEGCCSSDGQDRKSIKFKICKKIAQVLNKEHFNAEKRQINSTDKINNMDRNYRIQHSKHDKNRIMHNISSYSPLSRPNNYSSYHCYNNGPLTMEMW